MARPEIVRQSAAARSLHYKDVRRARPPTATAGALDELGNRGILPGVHRVSPGLRLLLALAALLAASAAELRASIAEVRCVESVAKKGDEVFLQVQVDAGPWERVPAEETAGHLMTATGDLAQWNPKRDWAFQEQISFELWLVRGKRGVRLGATQLLAADGPTTRSDAWAERGSYTLALTTVEVLDARERAQAAYDALLHSPAAALAGHQSSAWTTVQRELLLLASPAAAALEPSVSELVRALRAARLAPEPAAIADLAARQTALRAQLAAAKLHTPALDEALKRLDLLAAAAAPETDPPPP